MAPANKKQLKDAEEENALSATSVTNPSESKGLFTVAGLFTSLLPAYLFASVVHLDIASNIIVYAVFTILASQLLSYSYGVFADKQVHGILSKRSDAVRLEASKKGNALSSSEVQRKANAVANHEASYLAIYYNNALFVFLSLFFGFFLFGNFTPAVNYSISSVFAAGITVLVHA